MRQNVQTPRQDEDVRWSAAHADGLIAEVIHYDKVLSTRQMHAVGHYLQHKYRIDGAYTDERAALSEANATSPEQALAIGSAEARGAEVGGNARIQLLLPPSSGCIAHRGSLRLIGLEPCDEARAEQ